MEGAGFTTPARTDAPPPSPASGRHQFNLHFATQRPGGFTQGVQGYRGVGGIQQPIHRRAAGFHPGRHLRLGEFLFFQKVIQLPAQRLLQRPGLDFAEDALLAAFSV